MSSFNAQQWQSTSLDENNPPPAPGMYEVMLTDGSRAFTSNAGKDFVVLSFQVVGGEHAGYTWDDLNGFGNEMGVRMLKLKCVKLGIDIDSVVSLDQLDQAIKARVGGWYFVEVRQNGEYRNTSINAPSQGPGATQNGPEGSDIPNDTSGFQPQPQPAGAGAGRPTDNIPFISF